MVAWLIHWIMVTRPDCRGVVTANTGTQLDTKTWATVRTWTRLLLWAPWFEINTQRMYHRDNPAEGFCSAQTCAPENSEAFAGQHAVTSTSFVICDEDSAIPPTSGGRECAERGRPMMFRFGNPTCNNGDFYECVFGKKRDYWNPDRGRATSRFSNKTLLARRIEIEGGEDATTSGCVSGATTPCQRHAVH
jgi:hypothetical protein